MEFNTPYNRQSNLKFEDTEEKIRKRKEIQDWVFGNNFPSSGNNVIVPNNNNNLYNYKNNYNNNIQYGNNLQINPINNMNTYPIPFLYINPTNNPPNYLNNRFGNNNINDNLYSNNLQKYKKNSVNSFFDLNTSDKDLQKKIEKEQYRNDLKKQMEEDRQRAINKKKEIEEQNRIDEKKNEEYYLQKERQEQEYEQLRKLKKNRKLKSQFGIDGNILTLSNDNKFKSNSQSIDNLPLNNQEQNKSNEQAQNINNYQSQKNINGYPRNSFEEKEELKNYVDQQYRDLFKSVEMLIDNQKLYGLNSLSKTFEQQRYLNSINNFNNLFRFPKFEKKINYKDKMKKYYISNDVVSKKVENDYDYIFKELSDLDNLTKNYKRKMSPKVFYSDNKKATLNPYYKNYDIKDKYKIKEPEENEENKDNQVENKDDNVGNKENNVENKENVDNQEINGVKENIENQEENEVRENTDNQEMNEAEDNGGNEENMNNLQTNEFIDYNNYNQEFNDNSDLNKGFYDIKEDDTNNTKSNIQIKEEVEGQKEQEIENNNNNINEINKNDDDKNNMYGIEENGDVNNPNNNEINIRKDENKVLRYENKEKEEDEDEYEYEEYEIEEEEEEEGEGEGEGESEAEK